VEADRWWREPAEGLCVVMLKMGKRSRIVATCLAGLVLGFLQNGVVVLCRGADGHVALEAAGHNHCGHGRGEHSGDSGEGQGIAEDCRPCVDFGVGWAADLKVQEKSRVGYGWAVLAVFGGQIESSHQIVGHQERREPKEGSEGALRSVVLVI
jgi:hypothetical protein